jgi:hypothetical protein
MSLPQLCGASERLLLDSWFSVCHLSRRFSGKLNFSNRSYHLSGPWYLRRKTLPNRTAIRDPILATILLNTALFNWAISTIGQPVLSLKLGIDQSLAQMALRIIFFTQLISRFERNTDHEARKMDKKLFSIPSQHWEGPDTSLTGKFDATIKKIGDVKPETHVVLSSHQVRWKCIYASSFK